MARGRKQTDEKTIRECILLYEELQSYSEVGRRLSLAPNTVKKIVNSDEYLQNNADLLQKYAKLKEKDTNDIIELIKSARYSDIANNIVDIFTKENLIAENNKNGIRNLISLLGNTVDKTMALKRLDIQEKQLELSIRQLELKEQELAARLENPDAFATVQIINDAPIKETAYGTN